VGSAASLFSIGSPVSAGSLMSWLSVGSVMSSTSRGAVMAHGEVEASSRVAATAGVVALAAGGIGLLVVMRQR
jgi:hypothetical protein